MAAGCFALAVALVIFFRVTTGVISSTSTALRTSTTESNSSASYSDSSSSYSYYSFHPDYPDCYYNVLGLGTVGDGTCDIRLNVAVCGWDGGDCCACTCRPTTSSGCSFTDDGNCEDPLASLFVVDSGCYNVSFQAPKGARCPQGPVKIVVNSTASVKALAEATLCSQGSFDVTWTGHIGVNTTIHVLNGTRLNINGISDAIADGQGMVRIFFVHNGSLDLNNMRITNGVGSEGGAIILDAYSELVTDNVTFSSNSAQNMGGAVFAASSVVELVSSTFDGNTASNGGAMFVRNSRMIGSGNIDFIGNNASKNGGALYIVETSYVGWNMQRELIVTTVDFPSYYPTSYYSYWYGYGNNYDTYYSWTAIEDRGETLFLNNNAGGSGGAMYVDGSAIYWSGSTTLRRNKAWYGGALYLGNYATVISGGMTTFASNDAIFDGGAIGATEGGLEVSVDGTTIFTNNTCGLNGGAIDLSNIDFVVDGILSFLYNSAASSGGALYASQVHSGPTLTGVTFSGNSAESGGAVFFSAVGINSLLYSDSEDIGYYFSSNFNGCRFHDNSASSSGGAIHSAFGSDLVWNTTFVNNSADIGGGMRVSGAANLFNSSFLDNKSGDGGGPAVFNGGVISKMVGMVFSGNGYRCSSTTFVGSNQTTSEDHRYQVVCDGCDVDCEACTIVDDHVTPACLELLDHTQNDGGTATLETLVLDPGYWRATNFSRDILACFNEEACRGGVTGDETYCSTGYDGPYCAVCSHRYVRTISYRCSKCSSKTSYGPTVFAVFGGLAGLMLLLFVYYMILIEGGRSNRHPIYPLKKIVAVQSLKIIIVSWQIVTQFSAVTHVVYPSLYQEFLDIVALVNFDFSWILSAGCLDVNFYTELIAATVGPFIVLSLLGVTYTIALRRNNGSELGRRIVRRKHANAVILLAFLVYSSASSAVFRTFVCDPLDDGNVYLRADYRIICTSSIHTVFQIYAGFMIAVYPLGIPAFFAILLFRNRKVLENAALRTYNGELVQQSTSSLWKPYKPSVFYYEVVECGRRLVLVGIMVFIYPNSAAQIAVTLTMAFIFALTSEHLNPYECKWDGWVARIGHVVVVLTMLTALLTKVNVSSEPSQSQNMFAVILVTAHAAMILTGIAETVALVYSVQQTDSPLPRPRRMPVLPVDSFSSIKGLDNEDFQRNLEHE